MSINPDLFKNPLIRDGVSQRQRQTDSSALSPDFVKLDERELADALFFAYQLSQKVNYYGLDGQRSGNWQEFFTRSTPVQIALISKTRPQTIKITYDEKLQDFLESASEASSEIALKAILEFWKTSILNQLWQWYKDLEPYTPLKSVIQGLIKTNLQEPLVRMQGFEQDYGNQTGVQILSVEQFNLDDFVREFWQDSNVLPTYRNILKTDRTTKRDELDAIFQRLFQTYRQIIQEAPKYLQRSLSDRQDHPPHLALYFAFWEVMKPARDDLNLMTQNHLKFFYQKVLCLKERPAEPDHAHLLFELAKLPNLNEFKLPLGTRFRAGKDALGKELFYKLDEDLVVHKAKIASLKGLFLDKKDNLIHGLYASAIVNSSDGKGGAFPKEQLIQSWQPFGDNTRDPVTLGLAIASDVLLLKEGNRTIVLKLILQEMMPDSTAKLSDLSNSNLLKLFTIKVSGQEKDWTNAQLASISHAPLPNASHQLTLTINLTADQSPLLPYRAILPGAVLPTNKPVLLLLLNTSTINNAAPYQFLKVLQLVDLTIETTVDQVRDLLVQNDLAVLDASKPFQPFGSQPKAENSLYIGSQEVFQKKLTALKIDLKLEQPKPTNWLDIYRAYDTAENGNFEPGKLTIQALRGRTWSSGSTHPNLFDSSLNLTPELATLKLDSAIDLHSIEPWNAQTQNSFLRLQLSEGSPRSDFLHNEYPTVLARQMVAVATNTPAIQDAQKRQTVIGAYYRRKTDQTVFKASTHHDAELDDEPIIPKEPYLPVIQSLSIFYSAIAQKKDCTLFHLYPFDGFVELNTEKSLLLANLTEFEGELLIGLQDLDPPTALPLLFQVVEDSADTALKKTKVEWFYLKDNDWHEMNDRIVSDKTNGLVASGIVHLGIPVDISKAHTTILDPTLYWIKARVTERSKAICQIINVHTQAAQVTFVDEANDPNHLAVPLPAGSIAKFEVPQPEIKTIEQPYVSFDGKPKELPDHFYLRVSEHLRHKGRAVTIFDYERLILEKFPEIYKVRCINHGLWDETQDQMHELVPGAVTLAVIPDLSKRPNPHDLEPKVNVNLLDQIKDYVASISSPWAEIKVVNPQYEKVKIVCYVKFKAPYDANFGYYSRELNQTITDFLAPWARNIHAEIQFGGKLYYSTVLDFIEQQNYVDYIVDFKIQLEKQENVKAAIASTPRSILTSELSHDIREFDEKTMVLPSQQLPQRNALGYITLENLTLEP